MAYTSGRIVKSRARKPAGLTVASATAEVRRLVAKLLPSELVTVSSARSYDLATDTALVVTTVTFPEGSDVLGIGQAAEALLGFWSRTRSATRITITRAF